MAKLSRKEYIQETRKKAEEKTKKRFLNKPKKIVKKTPTDSEDSAKENRSSVVKINRVIFIIAIIGAVIGVALIILCFNVDNFVNDSGGYKNVSDYVLSQDQVSTLNLRDNLDDYNYLSGNNLELDTFAPQVFAAFVGLFLILGILISFFNIICILLSAITFDRWNKKHNEHKCFKFSIFITIFSLLVLNIPNVVLGIVSAVSIKKSLNRPF